MLLEQARQHYARLGWEVDASPPGSPGPPVFQPSLIVSRGTAKRAILVDEDPFSSYQIGSFGAACRRNSIQGVIVCPQAEGVVDACDAARVDYLSPEGLGAPVFLPKFNKPTPLEAPRPAPAPVPEAVLVEETASSGPRWWRWAIVAVIWAAALYFLVRLATDILGAR